MCEISKFLLTHFNLELRAVVLLELHFFTVSLTFAKFVKNEVLGKNVHFSHYFVKLFYMVALSEEIIV